MVCATRSPGENRHRGWKRRTAGPGDGAAGRHAGFPHLRGADLRLRSSGHVAGGEWRGERRREADLALAGVVHGMRHRCLSGVRDQSAPRENLGLPADLCGRSHVFVYRGALGMMPAPRLAVEVGPLKLKNPVITASGTFGYGTEFLPFADLRRLGGICVKGLSLKPRKGNPPPRTFETPAGMINAIGLANVGVEEFVTQKLPALRPYGTAVIANVFGETVEEYVEVARIASEGEGLAALELKISCPNTERGG